MKFNDVLKRYHISPLKYDDEKPLNDNDYINLAKILTRFIAMKNETGTEINVSIPQSTLNKIGFVKKNTLIPISEEDLMDILMEQDTELVKGGK